MNLKKLLFVFMFYPFLSLGAESMKDQALSERQRDIVLIASNTANGNLNELKNVLSHALNRKTLKINEIKEILVQMYAYCGFPRSLNGIAAFLDVVNERKNAGIEDEIGEEGKVRFVLAGVPDALDHLRAPVIRSLRVGLYEVVQKVIEYMPGINGDLV